MSIEAKGNLPQFGREAQQSHLRCIACGYDLYKLNPGGDCPECGKAIRETLDARNILLADPLWLDRTIHALHAMAWMLAVTLFTVPHILNPHLHINSRPSSADNAIPFTMIMWTPATILALTIWRVTARPCGIDAHAWPRRGRWIARVGLVGIFLGALAIHALSISGYFVLPSGWSQLFWRQKSILIAMWLIPQVITVIGLCDHGRWLAARLRVPGLRVAMLGVAAFACICYGCAAATAIIDTWRHAFTPDVGVVIGVCVMVIAEMAVATWLARSLQWVRGTKL